MTELRTERLLLRPWRAEDRAPFAALNASPVVMRHFPSTLTREESDAFVDRIAAHFAQHGYGLWGVEVDGAFAGFTGLSWAVGLPFEGLEVGWRLSEAYWGQGYATEAAQAAVAFGLQQVGEVVSVTAELNVPSWRVMERLGMRRLEDFDHPRVPEGSPLRRHRRYVTP